MTARVRNRRRLVVTVMGFAGLNLENLFPLKDLNVFQGMTDGDVHEGFPGNTGESGVILHNGGDGDLPPQCSPLDHHGPEAAARRINAGRKPGRTASDNHQIRLDLFGIIIRNENGLRFQLLQGCQEEFFGLRTLTDQNLIGIGLRDTEGRIALGQLLVGLNVDDFEGNQFGFLQSGFDGVHHLVGTVGAGSADEDLHQSPVINLVQDLERLLTQATRPEAQEQDRPQQRPSFFAVGYAKIADGVAFGIKQDARGNGHIPFLSQLMAEIELFELDLLGNLPKGSDQGSGSLVQGFVLSRFREKIQRDSMGHLFKNRFELFFDFPGQDILGLIGLALYDSA